MAAKRCIFLAGAPDGETLCWDEHRLLSGFDAAVQRFLGMHNRSPQPAPSSAPSQTHARWRSIALHGVGAEQLRTSHARERRSSPTREASVTDALDRDFLEHSIAVLEHLEASQTVNPEPTEPTEGGALDAEHRQHTLVSLTMSMTEISSLESSHESVHAPWSAAERQAITTDIDIVDLKCIPTAHHIARIQPQTMTVNLLVGVINVSPARTVHLRRRNAYMDIVELTVGDETRAGFSVTFWLLPVDNQSSRSDDHLRRSLRSLSPGQIVLLQNVALSCFRGNVYGQSLSRRFSRNTTTITSLRKGVSAELPSPVASKLQRVREWTADFVGVSNRKVSFDGLSGTDHLPPDTQD